MNYSHKNLLTVANDQRSHEDQTNSRSDYFDCNVCFQSFELEFELAIHKKKHNGTRNALNLDTDDYVNDLIEFEDNVIKAETETYVCKTKGGSRLSPPSRPKFRVYPPPLKTQVKTPIPPLAREARLSKIGFVWT